MCFAVLLLIALTVSNGLLVSGCDSADDEIAVSVSSVGVSLSRPDDGGRSKLTRRFGRSKLTPLHGSFVGHTKSWSMRMDWMAGTIWGGMVALPVKMPCEL